MKQSTSFLFKLCLSGMLLAATAGPLCWAQDDAQETEVYYTIYTVAGTGQRGFSGDGGPAVDAQLARPRGLAVDPDGNLYIADVYNHRIRRVDPSGTITTIAGTGARGYSGDNGPASRAQLTFPNGVAMDRAGNLYIADSNNRRIRQVDPSGIITTFAGTGGEGPSGDGGPAVQAEIGTAQRVTVDRTGNLYFSVGSDFSIRRVDPSGTITTYARDAGRYGSDVGDGGPAVEASLKEPQGLAVDGEGNLYIADMGNHRIRWVDLSGIITTFAGNGEGGGRLGDGGPAVEASLIEPQGVAVDGEGNLYIADTGNDRIRRVDSSGTITTIAGTGARGYSGDNGPALQARLGQPGDVAVDAAGNIYIADTQNHCVRVLKRVVPLPPPTKLTATAISSSRIDLTWQDTSTDETGFRVQRRREGSMDWVEIAIAPANATRYSDEGLLPATLYHYRLQGFNDMTVSVFSNEAMATTSKALPPTVTGFDPPWGPPGTRVTLTGTHFLGATAVLFNGVSSLRFRVQSAFTILAFVPPDATSGPVSVVTPGGTAVSAQSFTVTSGFHSRLFVPIVLRAMGRAGSFFTSEMTLTNRGTTTATIRYTYTASFGGGTGTAVDSLGAGRQRIVPDAIDYLTSLGIPIGGGSAGGTLLVDFSNLSSAADAAVTLRVSTPVEEGRGRAGLSYVGLSPEGLLTGSAVIAGLRQNSQDRSNLAVQHAGNSDDGAITLRVTVFSGDSATPGSSLQLPDRDLDPGGFHQYNQILNTAGFANGYVRVERVSGSAPFYVYGVINDNFNSDGSFVFPVTESSLVGTTGQTLPVIIETGNFQSELTVTNFSTSNKTVDFSFVADGVDRGDDTAEVSLELKAGQQQILPGIVEELRGRETAGIGPANRAYVGALFARPAEGDLSGIVIGARTGAPDNRGGQYSLFYNGVPDGSASVESAWIYGLQQNTENRSNLALVNTGEIDDSSSTFEITIYDGSGESQPRTKSVTLGPRRWTQQNGILGRISQGYVQVRKVSGNNPFVTYGVINDGGRPGERSGDGAFLLSQE
ncbi:MAG: fibronectin type III domain-containing protein [Acidobacteriota bacterium]|nr:fibronectin type III domain-containing protein [Acidobacteriota bacterium]